ncbi:MAG: DNA polymerase III subunit delta' [Clostridia bacterium]|nr:DNA polymerase III subunit delta' [Clostridia bacterium]
MIRLIGNHRVIGAIENSAKNSTLPHAIILEGDEGTGKHTLAEFIALSSVCSGVNKPCEVCRECRLFLNKNHPDVAYIKPEDKKKSISVEQIRNLRADAFVKSHLGGKKVYIIEKADSMNDSSQNALLKILEEPPQSIVFILLCESASKMLQTIISRCVVFSLVPPSFSEAFQFLKSNCKAPEENIKSTLQLTHNNIGKSLELLKKKPSEKSKIANEFCSALTAGSPAYELLKIVKPLEKDRLLTSDFINRLKLNITDLIRENPGGNNVPDLVNKYDIICQSEDFLALNVNLSLFFTALVSNLAE